MRSRTLRLFRPIFVVLFFFMLPQETFALEVPKLKGRVNDYAQMISPATEGQLETALTELERTDSTQIVVLTVPSLEGDSLEDFSIRVAEQWRIGRKGLDNGAILIVAKNDRQIRIEVGYGLEGKLTDLLAGRIIRDVISPRFRSGQFDQGIIEGVQAMAQAVRGEYLAEKARPGGDDGSGQGNIPFLPIFFLMLIYLLGRVRRVLGAFAGGILFPIFSAGFFKLGLMWILLSIPLGMIAGLLISLFGSPLSFSHHRPSSTMGRGRSGFGSSRGFGGFSGGGGGFGGGGASGRW